MSTRRETLRPIITYIISQHPGWRGTPEKMRELRRALRDKWREIDGTFKYWPYKVWCSEIALQLEKRSRAWPPRARKASTHAVERLKADYRRGGDNYLVHEQTCQCLLCHDKRTHSSDATQAS